jgi:hypothetical protein
MAYSTCFGRSAVAAETALRWFGSLAIQDAATWTYEYFQTNDVVSVSHASYCTHEQDPLTSPSRLLPNR